MGAILAFLLDHKTLIAFAVLFMVIAGEGITIKLEKADVVEAKANLKTTETQLSVSEASVISLQNAIKQQNDAIQQMKTDETAREASHKAELAMANATKNSYAQKAAELMKQKVPQGAPVCDSANALINQELKNAK
jgi:hypothetical protein